MQRCSSTRHAQQVADQRLLTGCRTEGQEDPFYPPRQAQTQLSRDRASFTTTNAQRADGRTFAKVTRILFVKLKVSAWSSKTQFPPPGG